MNTQFTFCQTFGIFADMHFVVGTFVFGDIQLRSGGRHVNHIRCCSNGKGRYHSVAIMVVSSVLSLSAN